MTDINVTELLEKGRKEDVSFLNVAVMNLLSKLQDLLSELEEMMEKKIIGNGHDSFYRNGYGEGYGKGFDDGVNAERSKENDSSNHS